MEELERATVGAGFIPARSATVGAGFIPARSASDESNSLRFPLRRRIRLPRAAYHDGHCFFLTIDTHERHNWFELHASLSDAVASLVTAAAIDRGSQLYAWCLMPNHLHLLVQDSDPVELVRLVKGRSTPLARTLDPSRRLWQRSFYDHVLRREESVEMVAQYVFENPVRADLTVTAADYPWSGSLVWPEWRSAYR